MIVIFLPNESTLGADGITTHTVPWNGYTLGDFFEKDLRSETSLPEFANITEFMSPSIGAQFARIRNFKILLDKTFTSSTLGAATDDRHLTFDYPNGWVFTTSDQHYPQTWYGAGDEDIAHFDTNAVPFKGRIL